MKRTFRQWLEDSLYILYLRLKPSRGMSIHVVRIETEAGSWSAGDFRRMKKTEAKNGLASS